MFVTQHMSVFSVTLICLVQRLWKAIWRIIIWLFKLNISRLFRIGVLMIGSLSPVPSLKDLSSECSDVCLSRMIKIVSGLRCLINHMEFGKGDSLKNFLFYFSRPINLVPWVKLTWRYQRYRCGYWTRLRIAHASSASKADWQGRCWIPMLAFDNEQNREHFLFTLNQCSISKVKSYF